jgi:4-aminobutyrate aminotransferase/(S)-3-amino-2-methylpropionate transaminase
MDAPLPGGLGGTYAGSPLGCTAALAVIDVIREENLVERALRIGVHFDARLRALQQKHPQVIGDIRTSRGAMMAIELVEDGDVGKPAADLTKALVGRAAEKGLVLLSCGVNGNVIRFLPALTISDELIDEGLDIFAACLDELVT